MLTKMMTGPAGRSRKDVGGWLVAACLAVLAAGTVSALDGSESAPAPVDGAPRQQAHPASQASEVIPNQQATPPQKPDGAPQQSTAFPSMGVGTAAPPSVSTAAAQPAISAQPRPVAKPPAPASQPLPVPAPAVLQAEPKTDAAHPRSEAEQTRAFEKSVSGKGFWERRRLRKAFKAEQAQRKQEKSRR